MGIPNVDLRAVEKGMSRREIDALTERQNRHRKRAKAEASRIENEEIQRERVRKWQETVTKRKCEALRKGLPLSSVVIPDYPRRWYF